MEHGQAADATGSLEEFVDGMYNLVQPPLETLVRAEDKLRTCYNNMGTVIFQVVIKAKKLFHISQRQFCLFIVTCCCTCT